jgi:Uma2 family endonuclease
MLLELSQLRIQPGRQILLDRVSWQQFESILTELGERRAARISYSNGTLEIMVPLIEHEKAKEIIGDIIKMLLTERGLDYDALGSTTLKNEYMTQAVEPDACFYIQNQRLTIGKNRLDLSIDPPPDLAIEIDLTSRTQLDNYRSLGVPELWRYDKQGLHIYLLRSSEYIDSAVSDTFPDLPIFELVDRCVRQSQEIGSSQAIRALRTWLVDRIN